MNKKRIKIWGRDFNLDVIYKTYSGQAPLETQYAALEELDSNTLDCIQEKVKKYILINNKEELGKNSIDNVFKYIMPKAIYIPQIVNKKILGIMCHYKFEPEHGLVIVLENNKLKEIGEEDIIL